MSKLHPLLNINTYVQDGFSKVADVRVVPDTGKWLLENTNGLLYEQHSSWVYAVVLDETIVKIGETGLQLGILSKQTGQPLIGTTNRMGRLRGFGKTFEESWQSDTDVRIRKYLFEEGIKSVGAVSIWARQCKIVNCTTTLYGESTKTFTTYHKQLEKAYLTRILKETGVLPYLNPVKI